MAEKADAATGQPPVVIIQKRGGCFRAIGIAFVLLILVIIVIVIIAAMGSSGSSAKPLTGHLGKSARVKDNLDLTLTGYKITAGNASDVAKPGDEFIISHWKFHNFRTSTTDVAETGFKIQSKGVITDPKYVNFLTKNDLGFAGTSLAPGASVQRDVVFEISKAAPAKIVYQPDPSDDKKKVTWTING